MELAIKPVEAARHVVKAAAFPLQTTTKTAVLVAKSAALERLVATEGASISKATTNTVVLVAKPVQRVKVAAMENVKRLNKTVNTAADAEKNAKVQINPAAMVLAWILRKMQ